MIKAPKKLIEVALPLEDINIASAREKSIRHGHPSTLHLWWARRPLAAARAVLFAQLVNDPGGERGWGKYPGQTKEDAQKERERLFGIIRELVKWENTNNETLLEQAREEIRKSWRETCELNKGKPGFDPNKLPVFHDPFADGGSIPLEAQRLGLKVFATDINPICVTINRALISYPNIFDRTPPVGPCVKHEPKSMMLTGWDNALGLCEDVWRYANQVFCNVGKRISQYYPPVDIPGGIGQGKGEIVSYIWARSVESPSPAFSGVYVPLMTTFWLCSKKGKEKWLRPIINGGRIRFEIADGQPKDINLVKKGTKISRGANFKCLLSDSPISPEYIKKCGNTNLIKNQLIAIVYKSKNGRQYLLPRDIDYKMSQVSMPKNVPSINLSTHPQYMGVVGYGFKKHSDLFTNRQLLALEVFVEEINCIHNHIKSDAYNSKQFYETYKNYDISTFSTIYADAITTYLTLALGKLIDINNALAAWGHIQECPLHLFTRQSIPMVWDFAEANPISRTSGSWLTISKGVCRGIKSIGGSATSQTAGKSSQLDAIYNNISESVISTDPPYYDNVPYSDLSDFFYVWERQILRHIDKDCFKTITTPKNQELVADSRRHKSKNKAEEFFTKGMLKALSNMALNIHPACIVTIYYAFKQSETQGYETISTGWESFIESLIAAEFCITGTWPLRTERSARMRGQGSNALASSIVLVCRKRDPNAPSIPRRQFLRELKEELPEALDTMIGGKKGATVIAPVDLAQAAIGPGMGVYSRYSGILEADGSKMSVRDALIQINKVVDEFFNEAEGDMDSDTRFCIDWFMQYGFKTGLYGEADVLARAKGTSVDGLVLAGVVESRAGKVRLLKLSEYPEDWDPEKDKRTPTWEALHHMIRVLRQGGESEAGTLLAKMAARSDAIRQLAYRLYTLCERKGWAEDARAYNELIASWHDTTMTAHQATGRREVQRSLLDGIAGTK